MHSARASGQQTEQKTSDARLRVRVQLRAVARVDVARIVVLRALMRVLLALTLLALADLDHVVRHEICHEGGHSGVPVESSESDIRHHPLLVLHV